MTDKQRMDKLEQKIEHALGLIRRTNERCAAILSAKNHYLKHRAPGVFKRQSIMLRSMQKLAKKLEAIPRVALQVTHKARNQQVQNVLLMVTSNQARKLRALADADLRPILNGMSNSTAGKKRARLGYTPPSTEYARKMAKLNKKAAKERLSVTIIDKMQGQE
jgi:hypothetical protein